MDEKKRGRPGGYGPERVEEARRRCANGAVMAELAELFGIEPRTLTRWRKAHPELEEAIRQGRDESRRKRLAGGLKPRRRTSKQKRRFSRIEFAYVRV